MTKPARKFTVLDAMVLTAMVAVSFFPVREFLDYIERRHIFATFPHDWSVAMIWRYGTLVAGMLAPLAVSLSLGLFMLRLFKPRPGWRETFRQPGMVAATATVVESGLFAFKVLLGEAYLEKRALPLPELHSLWIGRLPWTGEVVAVAWLVLWLSGAWRAEPSWIDRAGRVVGIYWIASGVFFHYMWRY